MYTKQSAKIAKLTKTIDGGAAMKMNQSITTYHSYRCFAFVLTVKVTVGTVSNVQGPLVGTHI